MPLKCLQICIGLLALFLPLEGRVEVKSYRSVAQMCRTFFSPKALVSQIGKKLPNVYVDVTVAQSLQKQILTWSSVQERWELQHRLSEMKKIRSQWSLSTQDLKRLAELNDEMLGHVQRLFAKHGVQSKIVEGEPIIEVARNFEIEEGDVARVKEKILKYQSDIEKQEALIQSLKDQGTHANNLSDFVSTLKTWLAKAEREFAEANASLESVRAKFQDDVLKENKIYLDLIGSGNPEDSETYTFKVFLGHRSQMAEKQARYIRKLEIVSIPERYKDLWKVKNIYGYRILYSPNWLHSLSFGAAVLKDKSILLIPELLPLIPFGFLSLLDSFAHESVHIDLSRQLDERIENPYQITVAANIWNSVSDKEGKFHYSGHMSFEEQLAYGKSREKVDAGSLFDFLSDERRLLLVGSDSIGREIAQTEHDVAVVASQVLDGIDIALGDGTTVVFDIEGLNGYTGPSRVAVPLHVDVLGVGRAAVVDLVKLNASNEAERFQILQNFLIRAREANCYHLRASQAYLDSHPEMPLRVRLPWR